MFYVRRPVRGVEDVFIYTALILKTEMHAISIRRFIYARDSLYQIVGINRIETDFIMLACSEPSINCVINIDMFVTCTIACNRPDIGG